MSWVVNHRPVLLSVVVMLVVSTVPLSSSAYTFPSECSQPTSGSCPTCCKNLRNMAAAGEPALVVKNVKNIDKCIAICSNHTYYGLSNRHVCGCFDECSVIEVPPLPFTVTSGLVAACMKPCFEPEPEAPMCHCPEHASCLPGRDNSFKCCCKAPFDRPAYLNGQMTCSRSTEPVLVQQS